MNMKYPTIPILSLVSVCIGLGAYSAAYAQSQIEKEINLGGPFRLPLPAGVWEKMDDSVVAKPYNKDQFFEIDSDNRRKVALVLKNTDPNADLTTLIVRIDSGKRFLAPGACRGDKTKFKLDIGTPRDSTAKESRCALLSFIPNGIDTLNAARRANDVEYGNLFPGLVGTQVYEAAPAAVLNLYHKQSGYRDIQITAFIRVSDDAAFMASNRPVEVWASDANLAIPSSFWASEYFDQIEQAYVAGRAPRGVLFALSFDPKRNSNLQESDEISEIKSQQLAEISKIEEKAALAQAERDAAEAEAKNLKRLVEQQAEALELAKAATAAAVKKAQLTQLESVTADKRKLPEKQSAPGERRKALIIGNDLYKYVPSLSNAVFDAKSIAREMQKLGYLVNDQYDLTEREMLDAIRSFSSNVNKGDEVLFFYAGHGVQLGSSNYLLPVDIRGQDSRQVRDEAVDLQRVLTDMDERGAKLTLAVIDACRDNPFKTVGRSIGGLGLAPTTAAAGQMILFSAGAGQQALDKLGHADANPNGVFTRVFLEEIKNSKLSIDRIIRNVRKRVVALAETVGHKQTPAIYDQVVGDFYFVTDLKK